MIRSGVQRDGHGFRLRGLEMTRIETFTDAAFAFALTLLVISMDPPSSLAELRPGLPGWTYALLGVVMPVYSIVLARRRPESPDRHRLTVK
ncbi:hypothetical protein BH23GEM9_BH23GEM9_04520 [soil metagenome]